MASSIYARLCLNVQSIESRPRTATLEFVLNNPRMLPNIEDLAHSDWRAVRGEFTTRDTLTATFVR
jgi:hypothetical protein